MTRFAVPDWHHDFPPEAKAMWDVVAKALLIRMAQGIVSIDQEELRIAARSRAMMRLDFNGDLQFYLEDVEHSN